MEGGDGRDTVFGGEEWGRGEGEVVGVLEVEESETVGDLAVWIEMGLQASRLMAGGILNRGGWANTLSGADTGSSCSTSPVSSPSSTSSCDPARAPFTRS